VAEHPTGVTFDQPGIEMGIFCRLEIDLVIADLLK